MIIHKNFIIYSIREIYVIANKESEFVKSGGKFITHVPEVMDFS